MIAKKANLGYNITEVILCANWLSNLSNTIKRIFPIGKCANTIQPVQIMP